MSPLSNSVYSSVFTYNPYVLTYQHLTTKPLIELHHIKCVSLDISILIVRFGRYPYEPSEMNSPPSTKVSWLFDKLYDNNVSDDGLSLSASVAVILTLGNDAILVAYQK